MLDGEHPKRQQLKRQQSSTNVRELPLLSSTWLRLVLL
jgi:hypothetical protein